MRLAAWLAGGAAGGPALCWASGRWPEALCHAARFAGEFLLGLVAVLSVCAGAFALCVALMTDEEEGDEG